MNNIALYSARSKRYDVKNNNDIINFSVDDAITDSPATDVGKTAENGPTSSGSDNNNNNNNNVRCRVHVRVSTVAVVSARAPV